MVLVGLYKVPEIADALAALAPPVSVPVTEGIDQLYNAPAGTIPLRVFVGVKVNEAPLQIVVVIVLITAKGLTVTVMVKAVPLQLPETGVTL